MNKAYTRIDWENEPSTNTPINETNLNKMDSTLDELDNRVIAQDTSKADKTEVSTLIANVEFDESTGIITVTRKNGSSFTIDTKLEKIAINFTYDKDTQQIILTLVDGTKQYIDLSALITQYEFLDSDTITFVVQSDGKIKAEVLDGSITENKLQSNYLAQIKVETAKSETYMNNASSSATQAKSYAVGGTGTREGEDTDNAKYYYQQAKSTDVGQLRQDVDEINRNLDNYNLNNKFDGNTIQGWHRPTDGQYENPSVNNREIQNPFSVSDVLRVKTYRTDLSITVTEFHDDTFIQAQGKENVNDVTFKLSSNTNKCYVSFWNKNGLNENNIGEIAVYTDNEIDLSRDDINHCAKDNMFDGIYEQGVPEDKYWNCAVYNKNNIKCLPNQKITVTYNGNCERVAVLACDENGNRILVNDGNGSNTTTVITPENSAYITFVVVTEKIGTTITPQTASTATVYVGVIADINASLGDYGLNNVCTKIVQGYANAYGVIENVNDWVRTEKINIVGGKLVSIKTNYNPLIIRYCFYNGDTFVSYNDFKNTNNASMLAPSNADSVIISIATNTEGETVTPSEVGNVGVYINNEIEVLKNDLTDVESNTSLLGIRTLYDKIGGKPVSETYDGYYFGDGDPTCAGIEASASTVGKIYLNLKTGKLYTVTSHDTGTGHLEYNFVNTTTFIKLSDYVKSIKDALDNSHQVLRGNYPTETGEVVLPYPSGFDKHNSYIVSIKVLFSDTWWDLSSLFRDITPLLNVSYEDNGIGLFNNCSELYGSELKVVLIKF